MEYPWLMLGDCLERMKEIPDGSVDMILCDLPYGTTACKWDVVIPLEPLWEQYWRILKPTGAVALFCSQPFTSFLGMSGIKQLKYAYVWEKTNPSNIGNAAFEPMKYSEDILIFYRSRPIFNKQMIERDPSGAAVIRQYQRKGTTFKMSLSAQKCSKEPKEYDPNKYDANFKNPSNILRYKSVRGKKHGRLHPTQKPVALLECLVRTYTNEGEVVLDNTMGSGSTGVACVNTKRKFIGIEKDEKYFAIAENRIKATVPIQITTKI